MSTFSIIIAAYNVGKYIQEAINSCINQSNVVDFSYEIIVINDGSTDDTSLLLEKYSSYSNIIIINQENAGLSAVRNKGVCVSKGDYILYLDGDDWLSPNALYLLNIAVEQSDLVLFPMVYYFDEKNMVIQPYPLKEKRYTTTELLRRTIGCSIFNVTPAPCKCYKREILMQFDQKFINGILHEDGPYFMDTMCNFKNVTYVNEPLYFYRQNREDSITTSGRTYRNVEGIIKGNSHILSVYGYSNPDVNLYYISSSVMQIIFKYKDKDDQKKVFGYYRKLSTKKFLLRSLINSRFSLQTSILTMLVIIDPAVLNILKRYY